MSFGQSIHEDYTQPYIGFSGITIIPNFGTMSASLSASAPVEGQNTQRWGVGLGVATVILGEFTKLNVNYSVEDGSAIFGTPRVDEVVRIGMARQVADRVRVNLSVESRHSTIAAYDGESFNIGFELRPWSR